MWCGSCHGSAGLSLSAPSPPLQLAHARCRWVPGAPALRERPAAPCHPHTHGRLLCDPVGPRNCRRGVDLRVLSRAGFALRGPCPLGRALAAPSPPFASFASLTPRGGVPGHPRLAHNPLTRATRTAVHLLCDPVAPRMVGAGSAACGSGRPSSPLRGPYRLGRARPTRVSRATRSPARPASADGSP